MELKEYQEQVKRSLKILPTMTENIAHMLYGMTGEFDESMEALEKKDAINLAEELTDVNWFICNYANFKGINISQHFNFTLNTKPILYDYIDSAVNQLQRKISKLTDLEKRKLAYNSPIDSDLLLERILDVFKALNYCYNIALIDPFASMQRNINKLKVRFPDKFSDENAIKRDLELERIMLES